MPIRTATGTHQKEKELLAVDLKEGKLDKVLDRIFM
jgi:hypothetical protein